MGAVIRLDGTKWPAKPEGCRVSLRQRGSHNSIFVYKYVFWILAEMSLVSLVEVSFSRIKVCHTTFYFEYSNMRNIFPMV